MGKSSLRLVLTLEYGGSMKLELTKGEVTTVVDMRAWSKAFGKSHKLIAGIFLGPVIIVLSVGGMLLGGDKPVSAIFLFVSLLMTGFIPSAIKKFKKSKKEILDNVVAEEHRK